eukprot:CAMPEP_0201576554 /NCGR_PEP_ID=MMETSP0190_2-20130828/22437_1 /ASSEMBLY_ACC=CAM_ASM_000263 /TAXON_ID=37353 /ORGANISM="Rosalina sp." /LENGTH=212 /DNA_ID=CAMNT_0048007535 /DNA_START=90 /DNA_END=728 /DNA_ORIENTATION=+
MTKSKSSPTNYRNNNSSNSNKKTDVYEINFSPSSPSSSSSSSSSPNVSSNGSSNGSLQNNKKKVPFISKNAKPLPSKPKSKSPRSKSPRSKSPRSKSPRSASNFNKKYGMPLAQPQKVTKYNYIQQKPMKISFDDTKTNEKQDKGWDPEAYKVGKSRVKNRPAQNSIAGKLLAQQKAEELEKLAEEQEEQELKAKASQINYAPLQSAASLKK